MNQHTAPQPYEHQLTQQFSPSAILAPEVITSLTNRLRGNMSAIGAGDCSIGLSGHYTAPTSEVPTQLVYALNVQWNGTTPAQGVHAAMNIALSDHHVAKEWMTGPLPQHTQRLAGEASASATTAATLPAR